MDYLPRRAGSGLIRIEKWGGQHENRNGGSTRSGLRWQRVIDTERVRANSWISTYIRV